MGRAMDYSYAQDKSDPVERALKTDPLAAAEQITGKSYKDDENTSALGMLLAMEHNHDKAALLSEADDTHYRTPWLTFLRIIEEEGFAIESLTPYTYAKHGEPRQMHMLVAVHPEEGILIQASSYRGTPESDETVNGATMRYNLIFNSDVENYHQFTSSGSLSHIDDAPHSIPNPDYDEERGWDWSDTERRDLNPRTLTSPEWQDRSKLVWAGDHDIREGFRHNLRKLRENGTFLNPWVVNPWITPNLNLNELDAYYDLARDFSPEGREADRLNLLKTFESVPAALALFKDARER